MGREFHVRFREGLGVQFPRATRLVLGFACEEDARRVLEVLPKRFGKYGRTFHPGKTRLVRFLRPEGGPPTTEPQGGGPGESLDFLGFTLLWSRSKRGNWVVKRKTARGRFRRALQRISDWCRRHLHEPMREQYEALRRKLQGHYQYFGVIGNGRSLWCFRDRVQEIWQRWLSRRRRGGGSRWERLKRWFAVFPLPNPPGWIAPHAAKP